MGTGLSKSVRISVSDLHDFAEELGLLLCFRSPDTRVEVGSLLLEEVVGHHTELQAGTSSEEDDAVALGNVQQLLEQSHSLIYDGLEVLGTMAHFHQGEPAALEIEAGSSSGLHHFAGKLGRTGVEIVLLHNGLLVYEFMSLILMERLAAAVITLSAAKIHLFLHTAK